MSKKQNGDTTETAGRAGVPFPPIGGVDGSVKLTKVDPFQSMHTFSVSPTDESKKRWNMEPGVRLGGYYQESKKIVNAAFINGEATLHIFKDQKQQVFGIWGVAYLDAVIPMAKRGQFLGITYEGKQMRTTRYGEKETHSFLIETTDGQTLDRYAADEEEMPST